MEERQCINRKFKIASKNVFRTMKGEGSEPVRDVPDQEKLEKFWGGLWGTETDFNKEAPWLKTLERQYATIATQVEYEITDEVLDKVIAKMPNDKPGIDLTTRFWIKALQCTKQHLKRSLEKVFLKQVEIPTWLITTKTILMAKSKETNNEQNYRPIAIQNIMYKIYTGIIAEFVMEHCTRNAIVTEEQAARKRGSWGSVDQLLVNKMIYKEVKERRKNLITVWLDYKKAFDSIPHAGADPAKNLTGFAF